MQALTLCDLLYVSQREVIVVHYLHGVWRYQEYNEHNKSSRFFLCSYYYKSCYIMSKRIIIPSVLCTIILIVAIFTCIGGGSKIEVILPEQPNNEDTVNSEEVKDSIKLKVYVENSGSMDAYMCAGSNLKDAVFDYVSDLKRLSTSCSLYYINSKVILCESDLNSYIKNLTPQSFAHEGGDRNNTDLRQIMDTIIKRNDSTTVSIFVSDCVFDLPQNAIDFLGNCQISIKNIFRDALDANSNLGVEIIRLESKVDGKWSFGQKPDSKFKNNVKRPYYIWVIGDQRYLAKFNRNVPIEDIKGGIKKYCAYATPKTIPVILDRKIINTNHSGKTFVEFLVDLWGSLQMEKVCIDTAQYKTNNPSQVRIASVDKITDKTSSYSHVIKLEISNPETIYSENISFSYPYLAEWISEYDDTTGELKDENLAKTTGLKALIQGVAEAYKNYSKSEVSKNLITYGTISFELKKQ